MLTSQARLARRTILQAGIFTAGALLLPDGATAATTLVDPFIGSIPLAFPLATGTFQTPLSNNWHALREGQVYPWNHRIATKLRTHDGVDVYPLDGQPMPRVYAPLRATVAAVCLRSDNTVDAAVTYKVSRTTPPPWDYSQAVDDVARLPLYGNFVWLASTDPASFGYFVFFCHLQNEGTLRALSLDQPVTTATPLGLVGDTGNAVGAPQLHVEIHYPSGGSFTCSVCTPAKSGLTVIDSYASLKGASLREAGATAPLAAIKLNGTASGTLAGDRGGAFASYHVGNQSSTSTLTLNYSPFDAVWAHGVGFTVYQQGVKLGTTTGQATGLGDSANLASARLTTPPLPDRSPLFIQVFNYGDATISYNLIAS